MQLCKSIKQSAPNVRVIVFDVGLSTPSAKNISALATVRHFHGDAWAPHVNAFTVEDNYAWKPAMVYTIARENPQSTIFWNDVTNVFNKHTFAQVETAVARHGICISNSNYGLAKNNVHPKTVDSLIRGPISLDPLILSQNLERPLLGTSSVAFDVSRPLVRKILHLWLNYAMSANTIAPDGANFKNHKYDAAGLSLIVGQYLPGTANDVIVPLPVRTGQNADAPTILSMLQDAVQETIDDGSLFVAFASSFAFAGFLLMIRSFEKR